MFHASAVPEVRLCVPQPAQVPAGGERRGFGLGKGVENVVNRHTHRTGSSFRRRAGVKGIVEFTWHSCNGETVMIAPLDWEPTIVAVEDGLKLLVVVCAQVTLELERGDMLSSPKPSRLWTAELR